MEIEFLKILYIFFHKARKYLFKKIVAEYFANRRQTMHALESVVTLALGEFAIAVGHRFFSISA